MDRPNRQQRENEEITNTGGGVEDYDLLPCIAHNIPTYQCRECSNVGTPTPSSQTPNYPSPQRTHAKPYYTSQSPPSTYAQALIQSPTPAPRPVGGTNRDGKRPEQPRAKSPRPPQQCPKGPVAIPVKGQPVSGSNTYAQVAAPRNNFIGYRDPRYPQPMPTPQRAQPQQGQIHPESSAQAQARYPMLSMRQEVPEQTRPPQAAYITPQQTPIQPGRGANNANGYDINPIPGDVAGWINQASQTPSRFYKINTTNGMRTPSSAGIASPLSTSTTTSSNRRTRADLFDPKHPHACPDCGQRYDKPGERNKHQRRVHGPKEARPHKCPHCPERCNHPREVERHIASIHPEHCPNLETFYCFDHACPKSIQGFARKDHRDRHFRQVHRPRSQAMSRSSSSFKSGS